MPTCRVQEGFGWSYRMRVGPSAHTALSVEFTAIMKSITGSSYRKCSALLAGEALEMYHEYVRAKFNNQSIAIRISEPV